MCFSRIRAVSWFVPVEVRWLAWGKGSQEDGSTISVPREFVDARAACTMETRTEPQGAYLSRSSAFCAPGITLRIDAGVHWRQSTKEQMSAHREEGTSFCGNGSRSKGEQCTDCRTVLLAT